MAVTRNSPLGRKRASRPLAQSRRRTRTSPGRPPSAPRQNRTASPQLLRPAGAHADEMLVADAVAGGFPAHESHTGASAFRILRSAAAGARAIPRGLPSPADAHRRAPKCEDTQSDRSEEHTSELQSL